MTKKYANRTTRRLSKRIKLMHGMALTMIFVMCFLIGMAVYQIRSDNQAATFTAISPAILAPLVAVPLKYAQAMSKEIKKREKADS